MTLDRERAAAAAEPQRRTTRLAWAVVAIGIVLAAILALPGQTETTKYVNDLFIFLDGAHRILTGQVPNVDFHTSLGPLAFYLPAIGHLLTGGMAGAMPAGMALCVVALSLAAAHLIATRMRPLVGIPLAVFLLLIATVPANPGEGIGDLSFAMFYNRLGWSALGILLVLYLRPATVHRHQLLLDALCGAGLVLFMLYLKASYGVVGLAFLVFVLTDRRQWRTAALSLAVIAAAVLLVELLWHGTLGYVADIRMAAAVSGDLPDLQRLVTIALQNLADIAVFIAFSALLLVYRRRFRDFLFIGFCASTGILLIEQNFQIVGILTLGAGAAVMSEALGRPDSRNRPLPRAAAGMPLLLATLLVPVIVPYTASLLLHAGLAVTKAGDQIPLPRFEGIRLVRLWSDGAYPNFVRYNRTLADGVEALGALDTAPSHVLVLDFVGPFAAGLRLVEPRGDSPWFHWGRTIDEDVYPPAEELFRNIRIVMEPKSPIEVWTTAGMRRVYASYLESNYRVAEETPFWFVWVAKDAEARPRDHSAAISTARQSTSAQP